MFILLDEFNHRNCLRAACKAGEAKVVEYLLSLDEVDPACDSNFALRTCVKYVMSISNFPLRTC
jgi:hypothetical protein